MQTSPTNVIPPQQSTAYPAAANVQSELHCNRGHPKHTWRLIRTRKASGASSSAKRWLV